MASRCFVRLEDRAQIGAPTPRCGGRAVLLPASRRRSRCPEIISASTASPRAICSSPSRHGRRRRRAANCLRYVKDVPVDAISLDWTVDPTFAREHIQPHLPVQGNLDPLVLLAGGTALDRSVETILKAFSGRPFIFNLGHGILPQTPIAHVDQMLARVRAVAPT